MLGNEDMFDKSGTPAINKGQGTKWQRMQLGGIAGGVALSNVTRPPSMYGMNQLILGALSDFDGVFLPDFGTQHPPCELFVG